MSDMDMYEGDVPPGDEFQQMMREISVPLTPKEDSAFAAYKYLKQQNPWYRLRQFLIGIELEVVSRVAERLDNRVCKLMDEVEN